MPAAVSFAAQQARSSSSLANGTASTSPANPLARGFPSTSSASDTPVGQYRALQRSVETASYLKGADHGFISCCWPGMLSFPITHRILSTRLGSKEGILCAEWVEGPIAGPKGFSLLPQVPAADRQRQPALSTGPQDTSGAIPSALPAELFLGEPVASEKSRHADCSCKSPPSYCSAKDIRVCCASVMLL